MSRNKKPRKAYRPRPVTAETMRLVMSNVQIPPKADRDEVTNYLTRAIKALREGRATELDWSIAAGSVETAAKIEAGGIVCGIEHLILPADTALQAIYFRAKRIGNGHWLSPTLYGAEINALDDLLFAHTLQLSKLSRAELLAVLDKAAKQVTADGHVATVVTDIETLGGIAA
jgi:hypothetical protein